MQYTCVPCDTYPTAQRDGRVEIAHVRISIRLAALEAEKNGTHLINLIPRLLRNFKRGE